MRPGAAGGKVLIIGINYAPEPTGIAPYTAGMARALVGRGWRARVLTTHPHYPAWRIAEGYGGWRRHEQIDGVAVTRLAHYVPRRHGAVHRALSEVSFGVRSVLSRWSRPDVVVLVSPALLSSRLVALRARLQRIPTVTWVQDIYTLGVKETGGGSRGVRLIAALERGLGNTSARVVVIHDRFRTVLADLGITSPIDVVRNWSHVSMDGHGRDERLRRELGWSDDDVVVLHAGNMGAKQGLENVVHAAREAERRGSRLRFVLMGDGNQRAALEAMGASSRLQFVDPLPDGRFESALSSADILLVNELPDLTEMAVPSKLTTYFATGLPVIAAVSPASITHDEMTSAGAGPCVDAGDPVALVEAAESLAADPSRARRHGEAGRTFRDDHLRIDAALDAFHDVLTSAIAR
ncbi:glycosyltransferase [Pseudactinotalea suaedae]|uniref:glycosyltransferase n=1 Tax=Pseudactinotalea suaedae TaxID=1524924 RepID=UPI0012E2B704|nr:glycosyltransferase [Pseudactinotalea suaedae]